MNNQIINWIFKNWKLIIALAVILAFLAFVLYYFWKSRKEKFPPQENNPDEPKAPEKNFSPPTVAEQAKRQTPPRDEKGRFIKRPR